MYELLGDPINTNISPTQNTDYRTTNWWYQPPLWTHEYNKHTSTQPL